MLRSFLLTIGVLFVTCSILADESSMYLEIQKRAIKWNEGLFGSTNVYARELSDYLDSIRGKRIQTPYEYVIYKPFETGRTIFNCRLDYTKFIQIRGNLSQEEIKKLAVSVKNAPLDWERSGILVKLSGKLRKFTLDRSSSTKRLIIFLDDIKVSDRNALPARKTPAPQNNGRQ